MSKEIYKLILEEKNLSKRNLNHIQELLNSSSFYVAIDDNSKICGFVAKERLINNYFEIRSWYVIPAQRDKGLADKLFLRTLENPNDKYLCVTFQKRLVKRIEQFGLKQISITKLPLKVIISYVLTRPWKSIIRHLFLNRSHLLLKQ